MPYHSNPWKVYRYDNMPLALHLEGRQFKSYLYDRTVYVNMGETNGPRVKFMYAMNTNKDETTFELLYRMSKDVYYPDEWTPFPPEILERLFKTNDDRWNFCPKYLSDEDEWVEHTGIEIVDGHFLFKYSTRWLRKMISSISVDCIQRIVPGLMVSMGKDNMATSLAFYPEHKYTMDDISHIVDAFHAIRDASYTMAEPSDGMSWRKRNRLDSLKLKQKELESYEKKYQDILDRAADAMNLMSSKYGIEIDI